MSLVRSGNRSLAPWRTWPTLDTVFDELARDFEGLGRGWAPAVDLRETEDAYTIEADVPGLAKEDITLSLVDNVVTIKGERKTENEKQDVGYHRIERRYGSFERAFKIPGGFNGSKAQAHYENGVLRITLPKLEENKPKQIEVKVK